MKVKVCNLPTATEPLLSVLLPGSLSEPLHAGAPLHLSLICCSVSGASAALMKHIVPFLHG